ncbi:MAG: hypothetical protein V1790_08740 [Planctomycetota bacterium]
MRAIRTSLGVFGVGLVLAATSGPALAQQAGGRGSQGRQSPAIKGTTDSQPTQLAFNSQDKNKPAPAPAKPATTEKTTVTTTEKSVNGGDYREVSAFFNVREANANVIQGEWEFEVPFAWETSSNGKDDDVSLGASLKYGFTDDLFLELEVMPVMLGDGGDQGNGELALVLFTQWVHESGDMPAFATWAEMRMPSGHDSSGVDGELHFNVTKTLADKFRGHLEGYIMTANGARGGESNNNDWRFAWGGWGGWRDSREGDRRHFQWGIGPGIDYQCTEKTIGIINYINRSSEEYGAHNQNILEIGLAHELAEKQHLKAAVDIGLDGRDETPNFGAKVQWSIDF